LAIDMEMTISEQSVKIGWRGWYCPYSVMFGSSNRQKWNREGDIFQIRF